MRRPKGDWTDLFRTFRMSLDPRKLWLAAQGVVWSVACVAVVLGVLACVYHAGDAPFAAESDVWGALRDRRIGEAVRGVKAFGARVFISARREVWVQRAQGAEMGYALTHSLLNGRALRAAAVTGGLVTVVLLLIWSYYGGAIMRLAAVEYALGERIELASARAYARRKHHSFYGAPLVLLLVILLLGLAPLLAGLIVANVLVVALAVVGLIGAGLVASKVRAAAASLPAAVGAGAGILVAAIILCTVVARTGWRVPYVGELVVGILSPLLYVIGLVMVVLFLWLFFGGAIMAGTLASADADIFDAWSRSFHYVFTHPWRYAGYMLAAIAHSVVVVGLAYVVRVAIEWAVLMPLAVGLLGDFDAVYHSMVSGSAVEGTQFSVAPGFLAFFFFINRLLLDLIFVSIVFAYGATEKTVVYFLMRRCADGTPISDVHLEPRDRELLCPAPPAADG